MTTGTGTLTITSGSEKVTGAGTAFTKELAAGYGLTIAQDVNAHIVAQVIDDTHCVLSAPVPGRAGNVLSGLVFQVSNGDFTPNISLPSPGRYSPNSSAVLNRAWNILDVEIPSGG